MGRARNRPRALLLDAAGTMVSLQPPAPLLVAELESRLGVAVPVAAAAVALGAEVRYFRAHMLDGRDPDSLSDLRLRCAGVLREALPRSPALDGAPVQVVLEALLGSLRFVAFDDVRPALVAVRARGVRTVAVSNWDSSLPEVLERTGIAPLLDGVVCSAVLGVAKPSAELFERALELAGAAAADALHVGDSPDEDVAGAIAAGIEPVLIDRAGSGARVGGVRTIRDLTELGWPP